MNADFEPLVLGTACHEIRHQYLSAEKARSVLAWHPLFYARTKACGGRSSGTKTFWSLHATPTLCLSIVRPDRPDADPVAWQTPLANRLLSADQLELEEPKYPLDLVVCPSCSLVQITETVPAGGAVRRLRLLFVVLRFDARGTPGTWRSR